MDWSSLISVNNSNFLPHGYCLLWQPGLLWTLVGSDAIIALSYFSIPLALGFFVHKQPDIKFRGLLVLFGTFILACGVTHLVEIANIWRPMYDLSAGVKVFTAAVSVMTALALWHLVPLISDFIDHHKNLQEQLEERNQELRDALVMARNREHQAMESENLFRLTQQDAPIGLATVSVEGRFLSVNKALADMLGYHADELKNLSFQEITHPDDLDADLAHVNALLAGQRNRYSMDKRYYTRQGELITIQLDVSLLRDEHEQPQHFISMIQDISYRKRTETALRRSRMRLERLLETIPLAVVIHNADTSIAYANAVACRLLGLTANQLQGKRIFEHDWKLTNSLGEELTPEQYPVAQALNQSQPLENLTLGLQHANDDVIWTRVDAFTFPLDEGDELQAIVAFSPTHETFATKHKASTPSSI